MNTGQEHSVDRVAQCAVESAAKSHVCAAAGAEDALGAPTSSAFSAQNGVDAEPRAHNLPPFNSAAEPNFHWGHLDGKDFAHSVHCAYNKIVHWKRNVFMVPSGKAGKDFIKELMSLFTAYAQGSAMESTALETAMTAAALLLQKPHPASYVQEPRTRRRLAAPIARLA